MSEVRSYDVTLFLPLWLRPTGNLKKARHSDKEQPSRWLDQYAAWISSPTQKETGQPLKVASDASPNGPAFNQTTPKVSPWQRVEDAYSTDHGRQAPGEWWEQYAGRVYFHPFIQDLLFDKRGAIQTLTRTDVKYARVELNNHPDEILLAVREIRLFLFPSDLAILVVEAQSAPDAASEEESPLSLSVALDLTQQLRRTYPPYWKPPSTDGEQKVLQAGDCPTRVAWERADHSEVAVSDFHRPEVYRQAVATSGVPHLARHWRHLLEPLQPINHHHPTGPSCSSEATDEVDGLCWRSIEDDRAGSMVWIALENPATLSSEQMIRLAMVDAAGTWPGDAPYSRAFPPIRDFDATYCYDRFWDLDAHPRKTTRYLTSGYGFTVLGSSRDSFFTGIIREHFHRHYLLMGLLAHMQRASLLIFWERLADLVHVYSSEAAGTQSRVDFANRAKWLVEDLADWVSRFYFSEVSNQIQGQELFNLWSHHLGTHALYQQVMEQCRFIRDVQAMHKQESIAEDQDRLSQRQARLNIIAGRWLPLSVGLSMASAFVSLITANKFAETVTQRFCFYMDPAVGARGDCEMHLTSWLAPAGFLLSVVLTGLLWRVIQTAIEKQNNVEIPPKN